MPTQLLPQLDKAEEVQGQHVYKLKICAIHVCPQIQGQNVSQSPGVCKGKVYARVQGQKWCVEVKASVRACTGSEASLTPGH